MHSRRQRIDPPRRAIEALNPEADHGERAAERDYQPDALEPAGGSVAIARGGP
jgi:hypothetical protein